MMVTPIESIRDLEDCNTLISNIDTAEKTTDAKINNLENPTVVDSPPIDDELVKKFKEEFIKLSPEDRLKALQYFRKSTEQPEPETKFETVSSTKREQLLERLKMHKTKLQMTRKTVTARKNILEKVQSKLKPEEAKAIEDAANMSKSKKRRMKLKAKKNGNITEAKEETKTESKEQSSEESTPVVNNVESTTDKTM